MERVPTTLFSSHAERATVKYTWLIALLSCLILIPSSTSIVLAQTPEQTPAQADRISLVLQTLGPDNTLRHALEEGMRGDGIHYFWMDMMKEGGVKQATFVIRFEGSTDLKITSVKYLRQYYRYDTAIDDPSRIEQIRSIGLEQSLSSAILNQARGELIEETRAHGSRSLCGTLYLNLLDDEVLPVLTAPADIDYCANVKSANLSVRQRGVRLTAKTGDPSKQIPTLTVLSPKTYQEVLDLVFPRNILKDQNSDYAFVLRYEPTFRAESQITITGRGENIEVVKYTALDGSIEARLSDMVRRGRKEDARRMARLIRIQKQYINVSSQDIKRFHESFFDSLRLSERARLDDAKNRLNITADGTGYRLWYSGQTEVQSEFGGSNITTLTRQDESPLLDWMKGVYLKVAAAEIAHR